MRKVIFILLIFIFTIPLFIGCRSNSVSKDKEISSIEVLRQSDNKKWTLSDKDTVDKFTRALNNRKKTNAKIDIRPHDYSVKIQFTDKSSEEYRLWVDKDINVRGVLMNGDSTWFINNEANTIFNEILK